MVNFCSLLSRYGFDDFKLKGGVLRDPRSSSVMVPSEPVEHGGLPGIWLQPVRRGLGALLHDFHEMLCGPAGSSDPDTPDPIAALEWRPRPVNKQSKMYCA